MLTLTTLNPESVLFLWTTGQTGPEQSMNLITSPVGIISNSRHGVQTSMQQIHLVKAQHITIRSLQNKLFASESQHKYVVDVKQWQFGWV